MGTLFSALDIARSGLQAAQTQLDVSGHNIANVNREGYTRQRVVLNDRYPIEQTYGYIGRGVQVQTVERLRETFLDTVYRQQVPTLGAAQTRAAYYARLQDLFQEPGDSGFGTQIDDFFNALNDFANNVEEQPVRMSVVTEAQTLAQNLNEISRQIYSLRTNANEEVIHAIPEINSYAEQIAALNVNIRIAEGSGGTANDLRDERDLLLDKLSSLINVTISERQTGEVDVLVHGSQLVNATQFREIIAVPDGTLDPDRADLVALRFADNNEAVVVTDGQIFGALQARDVDTVDMQNRMDNLAAALIEQMNQVQSTGRGLVNLSGNITGSNAVTNAGTPLGTAGLPFDVTVPGSFDVTVYDAGGTPTTTTININAGTTLNSLAASLNGVANFSASVNANGTLTLGATGANTFSFGNDSSNVLTALGINSFFTGDSASNISVSDQILNDPRLLSSSFNTDVLNTGDNSAALALAQVRTATVLENNTASINDYYESTIVRLGVSARANTQTMDVVQSFVNDFQQRRQEVSGVSLDEEAVNLMQFQRAYEASAHVVSVANAMMDALMGMIQ